MQLRHQARKIAVLYTLLAAIPLTLSLGICFTACNKPPLGGSGGPAVIVVEKTDPLYTINQGPELQRFDGVYPQGWPDWLRLPDNCYLTNDGRIKERQGFSTPVSRGSMFRAFGVSLTHSESGLTAFKQALDAQGIKWSMQNSPDSGGGESSEISAFNPTPDIGLISIQMSDNENGEFYKVAYKSTVQVRVYMKQ